MKVLHTADWHIGQFKGPVVDGVNLRSQDNGLHNVFYSGAINAMNFNDEGQERGFWIHEFSDTGKLTKGHNCITP